MTNLHEEAAGGKDEAEVLFRLYRPDDLAAMVALDALCFAPEFLFPRSAMRRFAEGKGARAVIAERQRSIVGFAIAHLQQSPAGLAAYCVTLDVDPGLRRAGLGARLLAGLERWAAASGAGKMLLHVHTENGGARAFYQRQGYRVVRVASGFYGPGLDALLCAKDLTKSTE